MESKSRYASPLEVALRGVELIRDPLLNKGIAFSSEERRSLGLEGLLPYQSKDIENQAERVYQQLQDQPDDLQKFVALRALQGRNLRLYFKVLGDHIEELMPIVYTPTVGLAVQRFSHIFQGGRGLWITPDMRGRMADVLRQAVPRNDVKLLVVTDNESILGLGDQGAGGMAISVGKLALYTAAAGIHPAQSVPISLDFGTDNEELLADSQYLGWPEKRVRGAEYEDLVDEFVAATRELFPGALVQWEDFRKDNALRILDRYRDRVPSFNDDIQGTGAVVVAGLLNALKIKGEALAAQRIVVFGSGAAGLGIARQLRAQLAAEGIGSKDRLASVAVLDRKGLLVEGAAELAAYKRELAWSQELAVQYGLDQPGQGMLEHVVERYRPTVLIGVSGQFGAFDERTVRAMASHEERPIIFPSSNPATNSEATPEDLIRWTNGRCLVAAGSPFPDVCYGGRIFPVGQGNNVFIFPGLGLAVIASRARKVTDGMIATASHSLARQVTAEERESGLLFPHVRRIRAVSMAVAHAVAEQAVSDGVAELAGDVDTALREVVWDPGYRNYVAA